MKTFKATDFDGRPFYYAGPTLDDIWRAKAEHEAKAKRHGCLLRQVPSLGSAELGPFHRDFEITRDIGGVIISIRENYIGGQAGGPQ